MTAPETKERAEVATKPPGRWFGWYLCLRSGVSRCPSGRFEHRDAGEMFPTETAYASHAAAEQAHIRQLMNNPNYCVRLGNAHWLGAYPEDETP